MRHSRLGLLALLAVLTSCDSCATSPAGLKVSVQPKDGVAGEKLPQFVVTIVDVFGEKVSFAERIEVVLSAGPAATLYGTQAKNSYEGKADFDSLMLEKAGTGYTLTAYCTGCSPQLSVTSQPFNVVAATPDTTTSKLVATPTAQVNPGSIALTATAKDRFGNPISGATVLFTTAGIGLSVVQPSAPTDANGVATGSVSSVATGDALITAMAGGNVLGSKTVTFSRSQPSPMTSTVMASAASAPADGSTPVTVTVVALDAQSNPLADRPVSLAFSGSAVIAPDSALTDALGLAFFTVRAASPTSGNVTATVGDVVLAQHPAIAFVGAYSIGGTVGGLSASGLVLSSPGLDDLAVASGATTFTFADRLPTGSSYAVTVKTPPTGLACVVSGGSGTVASADVTSPVVTCGPWKQVAGGMNHSLAITGSGDLYAWGSNAYGQLGDGTIVDIQTPTLVANTLKFATITAGAYHSLAITTAGELYAWGDNSSGQLGDGTTTDRNVPTKVDTTLTFTAIAGGQDHSLALSSGGDVYAWGSDAFGQLGDGGQADQHAPVKVPSSFTFRAVSAGSKFSLAITTGGDAYAWGFNYLGQLGDGTTTDRRSPVKVDTTSTFAAIAAGGTHSLALTSGGDVYAWGANTQGQLGIGNTIDQTRPVKITSVSGVGAVSAGDQHSLAVTSAGGVQAWGGNFYGQLGIGSTTSSSTPVPVTTLPNVTSIAAGWFHSLAITSAAHLWGWGDNLDYQVGTGPLDPMLSSPRDVTPP